MPASTQSSKQSFEDSIFIELEQKLRNTPWNNGASEAHGLLCALACLGVTDDTIRSHAFLLQLQQDADIDLIDGLFCLACRDLSSETFHFNLLLPGQQVSQIQRAEALSSWCQGFLQGFCYDNADALNDPDTTVSETLHDIMTIGHIELEPDKPEHNERALSELQQFLRVAVQLLFDQLQPQARQRQPSSTLN